MKLTEENGLRILRPSIGCLLHRKGDDNSFSEIVYLGKNDSQENYTELSEAEVEKLKEEYNSAEII